MAKTKTLGGPAALAEAPESSVWEDARYVAASKKFNEVKSERDKIAAEINAELARVQADRGARRHLARAAAIVHGGDPPPEAEARDLAALQDRLETLRYAVDMAEKHVDDVMAEVSREIVERVRPTHLEQIKNLHFRLAAAVEAQDEIQRFLADVGAGGTSLASLFPVTLARARLRDKLTQLEDEAHHFHGLVLGSMADRIPKPEPAPAPAPPEAEAPALQDAGAWTNF
jgi:hypothetical protein